MPFAFGQTINLSQSSSTRSGIIPIKWGFCANDALTAGLPAENIGNVWTSALMHIDPPVGIACIGTFENTVTGITSGNNETLNYVKKTEEGWRMQVVNGNVANVSLYIITRAGEGGDVVDTPTLRCSAIGDGPAGSSGGQDCYKIDDTESCRETCRCSGKCPPSGAATDCCPTTYLCCNAPSGPGGTAGYYKVTFNLENHPQEPLWVYLAEFGGNGTADGCDSTIKVQLFPSNAGGNMDMTDELVNFKALPGQKGSNQGDGMRAACLGAQDGCRTCESSCIPCPGLPGAAGDNSSHSVFIKSGVNISVDVQGLTAGYFWGVPETAHDGVLSAEFGWDTALSSLPTAFNSVYFGGTGGTGCTAGLPVGASLGTSTFGTCSCTGETFDTSENSGTRVSGQLIGLVVK